MGSEPQIQLPPFTPGWGRHAIVIKKRVPLAERRWEGRSLGQRQCPAAGDKGPLTLRQPGYGSKFHNAEAVQALRDPVPQLLHYPQRPGAGKGLTQSHQKFWT